MSASSPSSSSGRGADAPLAGTYHQAQLCEQLVKALIWASWSDDELQRVAEAELTALLRRIAQMMSASRSMGAFKTSFLIHADTLRMSSLPSCTPEFDPYGLDNLPSSAHGGSDTGRHAETTP